MTLTTHHKVKHPGTIWAQDVNLHSIKDVSLANKGMKCCSSSLEITGMQIKTTVRHHFTPATVGSH